MHSLSPKANSRIGLAEETDQKTLGHLLLTAKELQMNKISRMVLNSHK